MAFDEPTLVFRSSRPVTFNSMSCVADALCTARR
jgi:hypothetical protein